MKLGKLSGAIVLKSFLFFFPQLLEFLSRATPKLCPGDKPPWLRSTLLSFKDPWTMLFSGHVRLHRTASTPFPPLEGSQARCQHDSYPRALGDHFTSTSSPASRRHLRGQKAQGPSCTNGRTLAEFHSLSETHLQSGDDKPASQGCCEDPELTWAKHPGHGMAPQKHSINHSAPFPVLFLLTSWKAQ